MGAEGTKGNNNKIASLLGIGKGSVNAFVIRVRIAILKLKIIVWPDVEEKERMKRFIKLKHGFQKCIGIIDVVHLLFYMIDLIDMEIHTGVGEIVIL